MKTTSSQTWRLFSSTSSFSAYVQLTYFPIYYNTRCSFVPLIHKYHVSLIIYLPSYTSEHHLSSSIYHHHTHPPFRIQNILNIFKNIVNTTQFRKIDVTYKPSLAHERLSITNMGHVDLTIHVPVTMYSLIHIIVTLGEPNPLLATNPHAVIYVIAILIVSNSNMLLNYF